MTEVKQVKDEPFTRAWWEWWEHQVPLFDATGEQLGQAVGALIDAEADGLAEIHDTNTYGLAFHRRKPVVRPDFYFDEEDE